MGTKALFYEMICIITIVASASNVSAELGDVEIRNIITTIAKAYTDFSATKDPQSVLRFYGKTFAGIQDGESSSLEDLRKYLSELDEQSKVDDSPVIAFTVPKIETYVIGTAGWAIWDYETKIGKEGALLYERGKCTTIFSKQDATWLIQHQHCSSLLSH